MSNTNVTSADENTPKGTTVDYDQERKEIVIRIPYTGEEDLDLSPSGSTHALVRNSKINGLLDTGLNVPESFFITLGIWRYVRAPKQLIAKAKAQGVEV